MLSGLGSSAAVNRCNLSQSCVGKTVLSLYTRFKTSLLGQGFVPDTKIAAAPETAQAVPCAAHCHSDSTIHGGKQGLLTSLRLPTKVPGTCTHAHANRCLVFCPAPKASSANLHKKRKITPCGVITGASRPRGSPGLSLHIYCGGAGLQSCPAQRQQASCREGAASWCQGEHCFGCIHPALDCRSANPFSLPIRHQQPPMVCSRLAIWRAETV